MLTLKKFIETNKPDPVKLNVHAYEYFFLGVLHRDVLEAGSKFTHRDYPSQSFTLTENGYYPEISWIADSLTNSGKNVIYRLNWQLVIGSKIILANASNNIEEQTAFTQKVYGLLDLAYNPKCIALPKKGYYVPDGIIDIVGSYFAFKSELIECTPEIKKRSNSINYLMRRMS